MRSMRSKRSAFEPPLRFGRRYMRELVEHPNAATWIAEEDGRMAGFAIVEWMRAKRAQSTAYIQTIEVPRNRAAGALAASCCGASKAPRVLRAHRDLAACGRGNAAAIRLYEAQGYLCEGRRGEILSRGPGCAYLFEADGPWRRALRNL